MAGAHATLIAHQDDGVALLLEFGDGAAECVERCVEPADKQLRAADVHRPIPHACGGSGARDRLKGRRIRYGQSARRRVRHDRAGERMLTSSLNRRGERDRLVQRWAISTGVRHDRRDLRLAARERSGLVERDDPNLRQLLDVHAALDQDTRAGARPQRRHERDRNRDHQRARRRRDHEHGRSFNPLHPRSGDRSRDDRDQHAGEQHGRAVARAKSFDEALAPSFLLLRLFDHVDDVRHGVVGERPRRPDLQRAFLVEAAGKHGIADALVDGHALAGDRRLIHAGLTRHDLAIGRHRLSGLDDKDVADDERFDRNRLLTVRCGERARSWASDPSGHGSRTASSLPCTLRRPLRSSRETPASRLPRPGPSRSRPPPRSS